MTDKIQPRCYIILNKGLSMPEGKLAVQAGHAMDMVYERISVANDNSLEGNAAESELYENFRAWKRNERKKVLLSLKNDDEVQKYKDKLLKAGYEVIDIVDNGINFFEGKTRTGIVVLPVLEPIQELKRVRVY